MAETKTPVRFFPLMPTCTPPNGGSSPTIGADGTPTAPIATTSVVLSLPSWIFPSVNSIAFDAAGDITIPAIGVESTIFSFQVPRGFNGVLKTIGNVFIGGGFNDGSGNIVWRVLQNNQAMRGKEAIINSLGTVQLPSQIGGGGFLRILENDIISMTVLNVAIVVSGQIIAGRLSGWFYPKDEDPSGIWF
jgi:hypothetical protein